MKNMYILGFLILLSIILPLNGQTSYVQEIPILVPPGFTYPQFTPKAVFPCSDNCVIIVGEFSAVYEIMQLFRACVIKLDAQGNRLWQRILLDVFPQSNVVGINIDESNSVYYLIEFQDQYCIYKTDTNGNSEMVSSSWLTMDNLWNINRAIRLPNNEIIAVGKGMGPNPLYPGNTNYYAFMRLSATGDSLAYQQYPPGNNNTNNGANAYDMELDIDGYPVAVCNIDYTIISVVKFDLDGNILHRNDWDGHTDTDTVNQYRICRLPGSNYSLICFRTISGYKVLKFVNNTFEDMIYVQGRKYYDSAFEYVDGILLAGINFDVSNASISSYDLNGSMNWSWNNQLSIWVGLPNNNSTERIAICSDSCIIYVGEGSFTLNIVKLLPDGQVSNDEEVINPVIPKLIVYPNPMKHTVTIDMQLNQKGNSIPTVNIYNLKGQLIRELHMSLNKNGSWTTCWNGKNSKDELCSSGIYLIKSSEETNLIRKVYLIK